MSSLAGKTERPSWQQENKLAKRIENGSREILYNRNQSNDQQSATNLWHKRATKQQSVIESSKFDKNRLSTIAEQFDRNTINSTNRFVFNQLFNIESIGSTEWQNDGNIFRGELPAAPNINDNYGGWYR